MDKHHNHNRHKAEDMIINRPKKLSPFKKRTEWSATIVGWMLWFFFCRPLMLAMLWFVGIRVFYVHMIRLKGIHSLLAFFASYLLIILLIVVGFRLWNLYNLIRFSGRDKRKHSPQVSDAELDTYYSMREGSAQELKTWDNIRVDFLPGIVAVFQNESSPEKSPLRARYPADQ